VYCWVLSLLLTILSVPQVVFADTTSARQQYESGLAAYRRGDYNRAIEEWQSAYKTSKKPRFQYIIAEAYERLGELTKAVDALERFLEIADPNDSSKSDAVALLASLKQRLSDTGILIKIAPASALITVDGESWGFTPRPDRIPVRPGSHNVVVKKSGYTSFRSTVMVPAGKVAEVVVEMEPKTVLTGTGQVEHEENAKDAESDRKTLDPTEPDKGDSIEGDSGATVLYIISGALAAGTIGSTIWLVDRVKSADRCSNAEDGKKCDNLDEISMEKTLAITTTAVLGSATLAVLVAAIWSDLSQSEKPTQTVYCSPLSLPGAMCTIRF